MTPYRTLALSSRMTATEFRTIGESLYAHNWRDRLARDLSVSKGTIDQWAAGQRKIRRINALAIRYLQHIRQRHD